jgi:hypothetical protein
MKKPLMLSLLLAFACITAFSEDGEDGEKEFIHIQLGASVLYKQPIDEGFSFSNFRVGVTGAVLFSLGTIELGAETGVYAMEMGYYYEYYFVYGFDSSFFIAEIPLDLLVRINLSRNRKFAIELRGGGWYILAYDGYDLYPELGFNAGARLAVYWFYIGGECVASPFYGTCWSAAAGVNISF